ncbi:SDR family NAD(P)-dependent oxidoreductase [Inquilinus limosus]|uniref:SDR family NAD(P)-dependent oxidoreductase n=1 Tax=Inquilinus limosus TaxID=171674 RepID=UPI0004146085|nr:SDR family NAD(P)-dependent oxidoreductase [Inquilinus limosus]
MTDDLGLAGRIAVVTGAASGIGRATALLLARLGCIVTAADRDAAGADETARQGADGRIAPAVFDLAEPASCRELIETTIQAYGRLDILVNAAALMIRQPIDEVGDDAIDRQMRVNLAGPFHLCRAAHAAMAPQGRGRIVLFASQGAHTGGYVGSAVYAATKAGVIALAKSFARAWAPDGLTVNVVSPGAADTPMLRDGVAPDALARFLATIPLGRAATPEEVARCVAFLASDWAGYVTGHTLDVNGGQLMR